MSQPAGPHALPVTPSRPGRSWELRSLITALLILSSLGWIRLAQAIANWDWLSQLGIRPGPGYLMISGGLWGLLTGFSALALLVRWRWAPRVTCLAALFSAGLYWLERLAFTRSADQWVNLPFSIGLTLLGLGAVFGILALPRQRKHFGSRQEYATPGSLRECKERASLRECKERASLQECKEREGK